jgi:hypothetical protein
LIRLRSYLTAVRWEFLEGFIRVCARFLQKLRRRTARRCNWGESASGRSAGVLARQAAQEAPVSEEAHSATDGQDEKSDHGGMVHGRPREAVKAGHQEA